MWGCSSAFFKKDSAYIPPSGGSYVKGYLKLNSPNDFYLHVCSQGQYASPYYAYGGGAPGQYGGGGASDVRLLPGKYDEFNSLKSRIIVAAGGGGPDSNDIGGAGGSITGYNSNGNYGKGGTQMSGGIGKVNGTFGLGGGNPNRIGDAGDTNGCGSGGSGYFGGGSSNNDSDYGGGGGSSFISGHPGCVAITQDSTIDSISFREGDYISIHYSGLKFEETMMIDGKNPMLAPNGTLETGHIGNGFIRITQFSSIYNSCVLNL